ncbi:unnamed protein product [Knipowitschia caucasica]|uniref:Translationally-controlled tumor protein homolog n=1 Tax=Knipowitschia caucasica TaxID=637954 RepID=A0AAV2JZ35_KNICA
MIIYKCIISGDELFSDIYNIKATDDGLYEVEGKCINRKVGDIDDSLIGANASAEEAAEGADSATESGVDIVLNHKLSEAMGFNKKSFKAWLKPYLKAVKAKLQETDPSKVDEFVKEAGKAGKKLLDMVSADGNLQYFTGESMNADGAVGILDYREDGTTPFLIFIKGGVETEKC